MQATKAVYDSSSLHEKILSVLSVGSALGADKKNHLTVEFFDNVHGTAPPRASAKRSSAHGRGDGVYAMRRLSLARLALGLWPLEFGVHSLAALVSVRIVDASVALLTRQAQGKLRFLDASHVKVHQDASNPAGGQQNQAIGRTKGGLNTKINAWVDSPGRAVNLSLLRDRKPMYASRKLPHIRHCMVRPRWPTRVTTAMASARCCGAGAVTLAFHRAATESNL